ncbi:uncharacterized protein LOC136750022 [Amia ocellicauda]|uniref:uncharacterized protein LOC136750022 n=1 Tax=Amia ocellicauda TaxID=2972642 RepID=UPI00346483FC
MMPKKSKPIQIGDELDTTGELQMTTEDCNNAVLQQPSDQGIVKKKKKKKKKLKLTKEEKKMAELEKASKDFQSNREEYKQFLDRMAFWLAKHHREIIELFSCYDKSGTGLLSPEDVRHGMRDLKIPCVEFQLHTLTKLLDQKDSGKIDYVEIGTSLQKARMENQKVHDEDGEEEELEENENDEEGIVEEKEGGGGIKRALNEEAAKHLVITKDKLEICAICQLGLWKPPRIGKERFLLLNLRLITFDNVKCHPGNFEEVVPSSIKVYSLIKRIREQVGIESTQLNIFRDKTYSQESVLPPGQSLEECGFIGGPEESPFHAKLYYDYSVEFSDCPILNCDHYFGLRHH